MRYMGAKPYECTPNRRDYRNGTRKRTMQTCFWLIEDLKISLACKAGISYSTVLDRYRRQDSRMNKHVKKELIR